MYKIFYLDHTKVEWWLYPLKVGHKMNISNLEFKHKNHNQLSNFTHLNDFFKIKLYYKGSFEAYILSVYINMAHFFSIPP